jgi:hypothetical protein
MMMEALHAEQMRDAALLQLEFARNYTLELLAAIPQSQWLVIPAGSPANILWQVGHLAVAEYGLLLFRIRGRAEGDLELVPGWFRKKYGRQSVPSARADDQPSPAEMLERLTTIHQAGINEVRAASGSRLLEQSEMPYVGHPNKLGGVLFSPLHEMIHAGQIGMLRRLLGLEPVR